jgi:hypothetical protein
MNFKRRKYTKEQFINAVRISFSVAQVLRKIGLKITGANYKTVYMTAKQLGLSLEHFTGQGHLAGKTHNWGKKRPLKEVLVQNSTYTSSSSLKRRLIKEQLLVYQCKFCSISEWRGQKLSLQLDHINGVNDDHRLENLRLLCPNCHSQTDTFAGKNK